jgi:glycosyltransferase involved in cell wall biosynthesis
MHVRKAGSRKQYFSSLELIRLSLQSAFRAARILKRIRPDAIHLGKPHPINGLAARWALTLDRSMDFYVDCDDYEAEANHFTSAWQRKIVSSFEDGLPCRAKAVSVNTQFLKQRLENIGLASGRIFFVPNGVDSKRFLKTDEIDYSSEWPDIKGQAAGRVLYFGSLDLANHPINLLLDAFSTVRRLVPGATLLVVGGGNDIDYLQSYARDHGLAKYVRFAGRIPSSSIPSYLRSAHVTVDPVYDNAVARARSPLKVVESLAAGVPVVTGDVGDRRSVLQDGLAECIVKPGDATALAEGIAQVLSDKALRTSLSQHAVQVREKFWWNVLVRDWASIYQDNMSGTQVP